MTALPSPAAFDQLVVPVAGHLADAVALAYAVAVAERIGVRVTVLRQVPRGGLTAETRDEMELLADRSVSGIVDIRIVQDERPADGVVAYLDDHPDSLVCMATRAPSARDQLLFGSVAVEVARTSPVPMLLIGPGVAMPSDSPGLDDVVVCLDGSDAAERVEGPATRLATALGVPQRTLRIGAGIPPADGLIQYSDGHPGAILALATHARHIGQRFRQGSVAVEVTAEVTTPVLVAGPRCNVMAAVG